MLTCPALAPFFNSPEASRPSVPFSEEMQQEVEEYYFHHYAVHFAYGSIGIAMRSIPSVMSWDGGWGQGLAGFHTTVYAAASNCGRGEGKRPTLLSTRAGEQPRLYNAQ